MIPEQQIDVRDQPDMHEQIAEILKISPQCEAVSMRDELELNQIEAAASMIRGVVCSIWNELLDEVGVSEEAQDSLPDDKRILLVIALRQRANRETTLVLRSGVPAHPKINAAVNKVLFEIASAIEPIDIDGKPIDWRLMGYNFHSPQA